MTASATNSDQDTNSDCDKDENWCINAGNMWTEVKHLECIPYHTRAFKSNNNSFIIIPRKISKFKTIYKYCSITNTWSKIFDLTLSDPNATFIDTMAFDTKINSLFMFIREAENQLFQVNLDTNISISKQINIDPSNEFVQMIATDNEIHIIPFDSSEFKHFCWNRKTETINELNNNCPVGWCEYIIHNKSNSILAIGDGNEKDRYYPWESHDIFEFVLSTNKWHKWDIEIPNDFKVINSAIILSANCEYIIFLGGREFEEGDDDVEYWTDIIFVINTKYKYIRQSEICCPDINTNYIGVLVNDVKRDEMLVHGWIKECYNDDGFRNIQMLPYCIIELIRNWMSIEMVHLIGLGEHDSKRGAHWKINIDDIICDVECEKFEEY